MVTVLKLTEKTNLCLKLAVKIEEERFHSSSVICIVAPICVYVCVWKCVYNCIKSIKTHLSGLISLLLVDFYIISLLKAP